MTSPLRLWGDREGIANVLFDLILQWDTEWIWAISCRVVDGHGHDRFSRDQTGKGACSRYFSTQMSVDGGCLAITQWDSPGLEVIFHDWCRRVEHREGLFAYRFVWMTFSKVRRLNVICLLLRRLSLWRIDIVVGILCVALGHRLSFGCFFCCCIL